MADRIARSEGPMAGTRPSERVARMLVMVALLPRGQLFGYGTVADGLNGS